MGFLQKYSISPKYLTKPSRRRSGQLVSPGVKFVVAHDTGNPQSTASGNVAYYERSRDEESASAHIFVDDKQIIECIPALTAPSEKAWHVLYRVKTDNQMYGCDANDAAIGIEYCYGQNIEADEAYRKYVWVIAFTCSKFGLDPATSVVGHAFLDPTRKTDPGSGLGFSRRTYDQLLRDVQSEYRVCQTTTDQQGTVPVATQYDFVQQAGTVRVTSKLNIRFGEPSRMNDVVQEVLSGSPLDYVGWVTNGEPVNGNPKWYRDVNGNYFWSGATIV